LLIFQNLYLIKSKLTKTCKKKSKNPSTFKHPPSLAGVFHFKKHKIAHFVHTRNSKKPKAKMLSVKITHGPKLVRGGLCPGLLTLPRVPAAAQQPVQRVKAGVHHESGGVAMVTTITMTVATSRAKQTLRLFQTRREGGARAPLGLRQGQFTSGGNKGGWVNLAGGAHWCSHAHIDFPSRPQAVARALIFQLSYFFDYLFLLLTCACVCTPFANLQPVSLLVNCCTRTLANYFAQWAD